MTTPEPDLALLRRGRCAYCGEVLIALPESLPPPPTVEELVAGGLEPDVADAIAEMAARGPELPTPLYGACVSCDTMFARPPGPCVALDVEQLEADPADV